MAERLEISPLLVKFAGVAQYVHYCAEQHKLAYENGMDGPAIRDMRSGMNYIMVFSENLPENEREKYEPLCALLHESFMAEINSHKRLPGVTPISSHTEGFPI